MSNICFFVADLHGDRKKYEVLFRHIEQEFPAAVFLGGDLLPSGMLNLASSGKIQGSFIADVLVKGFNKLKEVMGKKYPSVFLILGNDDSKIDEPEFIKWEKSGLWFYVHNQRQAFGPFLVYGYSFVPPTPFQLKDFEKYDVSRYVDPGCIPPEEGTHTVPVNGELLKIETIKKDLDKLAVDPDLSNTIMLFHSPPYKTHLDRADLDGKFYEHVPLDVHIGSIAIKRFIEKRQPRITLHGHVHESSRLTGFWRDRIRNTYSFSAALEGKDLALIRFDPEKPELASREIIPIKP